MVSVKIKKKVKFRFKSRDHPSIGNQMWKYLPTKLYKRYAKAEEATHRIAKKIILNLKKEGLRDNGSPMSTILHAEGLDERDKVVGVVGELKNCYNVERAELASFR